MHRPATHAAALVLLALALAGCGPAVSPEAATEATSEPTPVPTSSSTPPAAGADEVPGGFPLDAGMVEDGGDFSVSPPSRDGDGIGEVEVCGHVVWPTGPVTDRLVTLARGPEYGDARELLVLRDLDTAIATVADVRDLLAEPCPVRTPLVWTAHEADTGFDSVTFSITQQRGLGLSIFQLTRVGRAVLLVESYGEGTLVGADDTLDDEVTALTARIAPAMCVFTAAEC